MTTVHRGQVLRRLLIPLLAGVALAVMWKLTPAAQALQDSWAHLEPWFDSPFAPLVAVAAFVVGGLVVIPVSVLIIAAAAALGPLRGGLTAFAGALASAAAVYACGSWLGRSTVDRLLHGKGAKVVEQIARRGIVTVAIARNIPVAPYSIVNLVAGASPLRFRDFMIGTAIGMAPGIAVLAVVGDRARDLALQPSVAKLVVVIAVLLALALASTLLGAILLRADAKDAD